MTPAFGQLDLVTTTEIAVYGHSYDSMTPNRVAWLKKLLDAGEFNTGSVGDYNTDPTALRVVEGRVPSQMFLWTDGSENPNRHFWNGTVNPAAPFQQEYGNPILWVGTITGNNGTKFRLWDLKSEALGFVHNGKDYDAFKRGWIVNQATGAHEYVTDGSTLVDGISFLMPGKGKQGYMFGDSEGSKFQQELNSIIAHYDAQEGKIFNSVKYEMYDPTRTLLYGTLEGSFVLGKSTVVTPEPGLALGVVAMGLVTLRRRNRR
jgi:hypothetical protein